MIKISPSMLAADFGNLREQISQIEKAGAEMLHVDIMDGHFVPNITFGPGMVKTLRKDSNLIFDVHLMIENPEKYIDDFIDAGADIITVHVEATKHIFRLLQYIKSKGIKAGVSINPGTPAEALSEIVHLVDLVLVMTVNPGFTGQAFIHEVVPKIAKVRAMVGENVDVEVDGGINLENVSLVTKAGANIIVAGAAVFYAKDIREAIRSLKEVE